MPAPTLCRAGVRRTAAGLRGTAARLIDFWWAPAILLVAVFLTWWYTLRVDRDFWYDEAMLVAAIRDQGWLAPWQPLANYEQASPYLVYLLQKLSLGLVGFSPDLLRVPGLVAYAVGGFATWRAGVLLVGRAAGLLGGVAALVSLDAVQSAGDFKQYVFEFAVAAVLMWLAARCSRAGAGSGSALVLLVVAVCSVTVSNTVVFVVPGLALLLLLRPGIARRRVVEVLAGLLVFLAAFGVWYLVSIKPSTVFQVAYPTYREVSTVDLYTTIVQAVPQPAPTYVVSIAGVCTVGVAVALVWRRSLFRVFVPALTAVVAGWAGVVTGLVPFSADRHVLFLVPLLGLALAGAVRAVAGVLRQAVPPPDERLGLVTAALAAVVAFGATATVAPNAGVLRQQAGQALAAYRDSCPTFAVDWWTQPSTELYATSMGLGSRVHLAVSTRSGLGQDAWAYRVMDRPAGYQRSLVKWVTAHPSTCILTGGRPDEQGLVLAPLQAARLQCDQIAVFAGILLYRCARPRG